jgi:hypothetical protein
MGATTVAIDAGGFSPVDANAGWAVRGVLTMSNSYATGGDSITAAQLGIGQIVKMAVFDAPGYLMRYNSASGTVQAYQQSAATGALTEVPNTTNLSAVTADFIAWGP